MSGHSKIHELDFIDAELTDKERLVRGSVRDFVKTDLSPYIKDWFAKGHFPIHLVQNFGALGIFGGHLNLSPYVEGFEQISGAAYGLAMQEIERADGGLRSFASTQGSLAMFPILEYGSEEQKNLWLPELHHGTKIGCFALTEGQGGSDPSNMKARVSKVEGGYVLNGKKTWITNGEVADIAVVWAVNDDGKIIGLLVQKGDQGFTTEPVVPMEFKTSMRASVTSSLMFDNCFIPDENILPKALGMKPLLTTLSKARFGIAWGVIGAAYGCLEEIANYVGDEDRIIFGETLAKKQLVSYDIGDIRSKIMLMQTEMLTFSRLEEKGKINHIHISATKFNNVTFALELARKACELLGANRISSEFASVRHARNLEAVETYEGTRFIHGLIQGADVTGKNPF